MRVIKKAEPGWFSKDKHRVESDPEYRFSLLLKNPDGQRSFSPLTTDILYTDEEREFLVAIEAFKSRTGKKFPTWSEALMVLKSLGYSKGGDHERPGTTRPG